MPSTMAPTKAKAMYAVNTLKLLTEGRRVIHLSLGSRHCTDGRVGEEVSNAFFGKKVRLAVYAPHNRG